MDRKYQVEFGGVDIMAFLSELINKWREVLDGITLQWHDNQQKVLKERITVRDLAKPEWLIAHPNSHLDTCWNGGIKEFMEWADANKLDHMSMSETAYTIFGDGPEHVGGEAARQKWDAIKKWGKYWSENSRKDEDGKTVFTKKDHSPFLRSITALGKAALVDATRAMATWIPQTGLNDGFGAKWNFIFAAGRGVETFGMHPEVEAYYIKKRNRFVKHLASAVSYAINVSRQRKTITLKEVNKEEFLKLVVREMELSKKHKAASKLYKETGIIS